MQERNFIYQNTTDEGSNLINDSQENQNNGMNHIFGVELPNEIIVNIFSFFTPADLGKISITSKKFRFFSNDEYIWRLSLKNNFGIEPGKQLNLEKFTAALNQQKNYLWDTYLYEFLITPPPEDVPLFLEQLFANPADIYDKHGTLNYGALPCAIELASARGWEEMVIYLITKGHLVPLTRATSLNLAIEGHYIEIVKHLINSGVDVTECEFTLNAWGRYEEGNISLKNVPLYSSNYHELCPLASAIKVDDVEIAKLLLDSGASFDNLSFVHPIDKNFNKENQRTVTQLVDGGRLTLSNRMKSMIEERQNSIHINQRKFSI